MLLIIDNYDSFTYNLYQNFFKLGINVLVKKNNKINISEIKKISPSYLVISPGPGSPDKSGISIKAILKFYKKIPILGVCLGHQAIAQAFGGNIIKAKKIMHGKESNIYHNNDGIFNKIKNPFKAIRYNSLLIDEKNLPYEIKITAWTKKNEIMGIRHKKYPTEGVQFHPESILTKEGNKILENFLNINFKKKI